MRQEPVANDPELLSVFNNPIHPFSRIKVDGKHETGPADFLDVWVLQ
jgi:hypothetical protein